MSETINICGMLVHATNDKLLEVEKKLNDITGVEVHQKTDNGRLTVTIERQNQGEIADVISGFNDIDGVISTVLIYQHSEEV